MILQFPPRPPTREERAEAMAELRRQLRASLPFDEVMTGLKRAKDKHDLGAVARYIDSNAFDDLLPREKEELIELYSAKLMIVTGALVP